MSQCNPDGSDCVIEENNITCITIDDSQDSVLLKKCVGNEDVEEGEVSDDEKNINEQKENICEIRFHSKTHFENFGSDIIDALKEKFSKNYPRKSLEIVTEEIDKCTTLKVILENIPMPPPFNQRTISTDIKKENEVHFEKEDSPDLSGLSELFMIDTEPAAKLESNKVPSYKRAIKDALLDEEAAASKKLKEEANALKTRKPNSCFNCGESGHSIRECKKPHNAKRIKNAKKACHKAERYHVDVEQRFAHMKPGCISEQLRDALGVRKGELPFFFYRMRVLGYPPAWLEEAKVEHSGITLFNSDGTKVLHSDEEEGETEAVNHKYNISKIHDFPGFNQDPGKNFFDDYKFHNVPPLNKMQMKEEFIKTLGDNVLKGYKRKKLKDFPNAHSDDNIAEITIQEPTDMDIEDSETPIMGEVQFTRPPPPAQQPPPTPPPPATPPPPCDSLQNAIEKQSPSLLELENQKQKLLQELQEANTSVVEIEDSLLDEIIELDNDSNDKTAAAEEDEALPVKDLNIDNNSEISFCTTAELEKDSSNSFNTIIKESFMGTPVLKFSPYDNLPNGDNFRVGVSDVINFENLPDSTGKYEQMKKVISKVRTCITKLQSEE